MNALVIASANPVQKTLTVTVRSQKSLTSYALWETAKTASGSFTPMPPGLTASAARVGSRSHLVAIDQNKDNVREFGVYTNDHLQLIDHLRQHGITTIAMESTGSYWQTLFNALQQAGFEPGRRAVLLVGGSQTKNVKGRKTDVIDCIWIQKLHSLGLLSGSLLLSDTFHRTADAAATHLLLSPSAFSPAVSPLLQ